MPYLTGAATMTATTNSHIRKNQQSAPSPVIITRGTVRVLKILKNNAKLPRIEICTSAMQQ